MKKILIALIVLGLCLPLYGEIGLSFKTARFKGGSANFSGNVTIGGSLDVSGFVTGTSLVVDDSARVEKTLLVKGRITANEDAYINGVRFGNGGGDNLYNTVGGWDNMYNNTTGTVITSFGTQSLQANTTGSYIASFGVECLRFNTIGNGNSAFGGYDVLHRNVDGDRNSAYGYGAAYWNISGDDNTHGGYESGYYGVTESQNTSWGAKAFNTFNVDTGNEVTFDFGDIVNVDGDSIYISAHGFSDSVLLKYTEGTSAITGMTDGNIYMFYACHADTLIGITTAITVAGSGTGHTLTPKYAYSNSTALGYNAEPDASNQVMLGDGSVTQIKSTGNMYISGAGSNYFAGSTGFGTASPRSVVGISAAVSTPLYLSTPAYNKNTSTLAQAIDTASVYIKTDAWGNGVVGAKDATGNGYEMNSNYGLWALYVRGVQMISSRNDYIDIKSMYPFTDDLYELGAADRRWKAIRISDNLTLGGKGQTASFIVSKENTIAGTDSSMVLSVDANGDGKIDVKGADGTQDFLVSGGQFGGHEQAVTLGTGVTTFAVTSNYIAVTGDGGGNTIATITGASVVGEYLFRFVDGLVTITDTEDETANSVDLSAAFTSADDVILKLYFNGTSFWEVSRSVN